MQKPNQKEFRIEKVIKRKGNKIYVNWKGYDNSFNVWVDKILTTLIEDIVKMSQYFPKPCKSFGGNINMKVDLSNYATKLDLKNVAEDDTSKLKIDVDKLKTVPLDLSKLSNVVNNEIATKT